MGIHYLGGHQHLAEEALFGSIELHPLPPVHEAVLLKNIEQEMPELAGPVVHDLCHIRHNSDRLQGEIGEVLKLGKHHGERAEEVLHCYAGLCTLKIGSTSTRTMENSAPA